MTERRERRSSIPIVGRRLLPTRIARPLLEFLETEAAGGVVLLIATAAALFWANSPLGESYVRFWQTELAVELGTFRLVEDLQHWVNDALMAIFFFVVGLEIKRELVKGELNELRRAALPVIAAAGGMAVPALIYVAFNAGTEAVDGWGIPMATDIAFAVGVLALLGRRAPSSLKIFLLSVAIADDIGAILVIAVFYSSSLDFVALGVAAAFVALIVVFRWARLWWLPLYVILGAAVWLAVFQSGVHATIAGVALGLLTPAHALDPRRKRRIPGFEGDEEEEATALEAPMAAETRGHLHAATSPCERLEYALHPWTSYLIIPVFALANAGVDLRGADLAETVTSSVTLGVAIGLVAGKTIGVAGFTWLGTRLGLAVLPVGVSWRHVIGVGAVAGIGFTVALFIAALAFDEQALQEQAKVGILVASLIAALLSAAILGFGGKDRGDASDGGT